MFDPITVREAVMRGRVEVPPAPRLRYVISVDVAFVGNRFAVAVGHAGPNGVELDVMRGWRGTRGRPVQVDPMLDAIAELSLAYNCAPVVIDQYAAEPIRQALAKRGVRVTERPWTKDSRSTRSAATRGLLQGGSLALLDDADLVRELIFLELHPLPSGRNLTSYDASGPRAAHPRVAPDGSGITFTHVDGATWHDRVMAFIGLDGEGFRWLTDQATAGTHPEQRPLRPQGVHGRRWRVASKCTGLLLSLTTGH